MGTHSNTIPYSNTYANCYCYSYSHIDFYAYTQSVNYSQTQSDSQASPHTTSSSDFAIIPHLSDFLPPKRASEAKGSYHLRGVIVE